jgi:hypothetical protein
VDRRQADAVGDLLLGHRQLVVGGPGEASDFEPERERARQVSDPGVGGNLWCGAE